jgi:hypothetical protein
MVPEQRMQTKAPKVVEAQPGDLLSQSAQNLFSLRNKRDFMTAS